MRRQIRAFFEWADRRGLDGLVERFEYLVKRPAFGCEECGNCVLGHMEYVCPQTCPKQMRNGPCGGTFLGQCEVVDKPCIWVKVMERAEATNNLAGLKTYIPPPDRGLKGTSSWINFYLERDSRPAASYPTRRRRRGRPRPAGHDQRRKSKSCATAKRADNGRQFRPLRV
jgi:hypothetical protein